MENIGDRLLKQIIYFAKKKMIDIFSIATFVLDIRTRHPLQRNNI